MSAGQLQDRPDFNSDFIPYRTGCFPLGLCMCIFPAIYRCGFFISAQLHAPTSPNRVGYLEYPHASTCRRTLFRPVGSYRRQICIFGLTTITHVFNFAQVLSTSHPPARDIFSPFLHHAHNKLFQDSFAVPFHLLITQTSLCSFETTIFKLDNYVSAQTPPEMSRRGGAIH